MDFLRKKLEEVEGEMHTTTGAPSRSLADASSSWLGRVTAVAGDVQQLASSATDSLQALGNNASELLELREELTHKDEALEAAQQRTRELQERVNDLELRLANAALPASVTPEATATREAVERDVVVWRERATAAERATNIWKEKAQAAENELRRSEEAHEESTGAAPEPNEQMRKSVAEWQQRAEAAEEKTAKLKGCQ